MKRCLIILVSTVLVISVLNGCGKSPEEKQMEKAERQMEEASEQMAKAGEKMAEGFGEGMEEMAKGMEEMAKALGQMSDEVVDSKVEPVDYKDLKSLLPGDLRGLNRTDASGEKTSALGMKISQATAEYENNDGGSIEIEITDMGNMNKLVRMTQLAWLATDIDQEGDSGYEKTTTIKGHRAFESWDKDQEYGQVTLFVAERFVVKVDGNNVDMDDIKKAVDKIDLNKLAKMK